MTARRLAQWAALVAWVGLGGLAMALSPRGDAPSRVESALIYDEKPTSLSSAPQGTMLLRRVLERVGFQTHDHLRSGPPTANALVMLGHVHPLGAPERAGLLSWIERGGRLVYAHGSEQEAPTSLDDLLFERGSPAELSTPKQVSLLTLGSGRVAVLHDGGERLSNTRIEAKGLAEDLPWLRYLLEDVDEVAFDEVRNGAAANESIFAVADRAGLTPGLYALGLALLVWLMALGVRVAPPVPSAPVLEQSYRQHLRSVGTVLRGPRRDKLCRTLLTDGTRRRLGPMAARPEIARALSRAAEAPSVRELAQALRQIEGVNNS